MMMSGRGGNSAAVCGGGGGGGILERRELHTKIDELLTRSGERLRIDGAQFDNRIEPRRPLIQRISGLGNKSRRSERFQL
jgi:hypothetical protein